MSYPVWMQDYHGFVSAWLETLDAAAQLPLAAAEPVERPPLPADAPRVVLISPHPDDEMIVGGLPLRMLRQCGVRVVNLAVTLGSNKARQSARQDELAAACRYIGFDTLTANECGLERINLLSRREDPVGWIRNVDVVANLLGYLRPIAIFYPHASDANSTHMGVHGLVNHALLRLGNDLSVDCFETEFWSPMDTPNVMAELSAEDVAQLVTALSFHEGEVRRNPYHLTLPAWMMDNVRRGAERMPGRQGQEAPPYRFATLYRLRRWTGQRFENTLTDSRMVSLNDDPLALLRS